MPELYAVKEFSLCSLVFSAAGLVAGEPALRRHAGRASLGSAAERVAEPVLWPRPPSGRSLGSVLQAACFRSRKNRPAPSGESLQIELTPSHKLFCRLIEEVEGFYKYSHN